MPLFTNSQLKRFSNIFDNAGQVMLGALVLTPMLNQETNHLLTEITSLGVMLTLVSWWISLRLERISS